MSKVKSSCTYLEMGIDLQQGLFIKPHELSTEEIKGLKTIADD